MSNDEVYEIIRVYPRIIDGEIVLRVSPEFLADIRTAVNRFYTHRDKNRRAYKSKGVYRKKRFIRKYVIGPLVDEVSSPTLIIGPPPEQKRTQREIPKPKIPSK